MVNNYDPKNLASSISNPATPQSGSGSVAQDASVTPQTPSTPSGAGSHSRLVPGTELYSGRYKVERLAAAGGMGAVYRATDVNLESTCAVKEMLDDFQSEEERKKAVEWFRREAKLLLTLNDRCIPRVRDFFVEGGRHYLVMDFIEGRTLGDVLEKEGNVSGINGAHGLPEARVRKWAQQLCSVLGYLHSRTPPIIFRDLKPSNIMVTTDDEIKLVDFGIARAFQSQRQSTVIMTVGYAPPEQFLGNPEPRSDLYALGATLHRLLTHHEAANNKPNLYTFPTIRSLRPDVSPGFDQVIMKALAFTVDQRWTNAAEMERAIVNLPPISATPATTFVSIPTIPPAQPPSGPGPRSSLGVPPIPSVQTGGGTTGPAGGYISAAQGHLAAGRIDAAYTAIQQAHTLEPNNSLVHKIFGQIFARRQPPAIDQAMQAYNRSLQINSNDAETHKLVGDVWLILRRQPAQAIPAYTQALRLNTNDLEAHQRLGECYESTGQLELALREFQEAVRLVPKNPGSHYTLAQLAYRLNQLPIAEREFVEVLKINPADHQSRFRLSEVYEREGKLEDAWRECNYVLGAAPTIPGVYQQLQRLRTRLGR